MVTIEALIASFIADFIDYEPEKTKESYFLEDYDVQNVIFIESANETDLLGYASNGERGFFTNYLKALCLNLTGGTRFVFNNTLTTQQRHSIHRMQGHRYYESITIDGRLNIFIK